MLDLANQDRARKQAVAARSKVHLQKACACGGSSGSEGECPECEAQSQVATGQQSKRNFAPPTVDETLRSGGEALETSTRLKMEGRFGHDFSQVRIHRDSQAARSSNAIGALAYTVGERVVFGEGQYQPHSRKGEKLLAHELVHTIQQSGGDIRLQEQLEISQPEDESEKEAETVASRVAEEDEELPAPVAPSPTRLARQPKQGPPIRMTFEACPPAWKNRIRERTTYARNFVNYALRKIECGAQGSIVAGPRDL